MATIGEMLVRVGLDTKQFNDNIKGIKAGIDSLASGFTTAGLALSAAVTAPIVALATASLDAAAKMESLQLGLTAVTGSAAETNEQMKRLVELAKLPGLGLQEVVSASINLQAAGIAAKDAERYISAFGNALASVGKGRADLEAVFVQLTQMSAKTKVLAADLKPIIERVPQVAAALRKAFGTTDSESISKILDKLGWTTQDFINFLVTELERIPKVTGGLQNSFENLRDKMFQAFAEIGRVLTPTVEQLIPKLERLLDATVDAARAFSQLPQPIQQSVIVAASLAAALGPLLFALGSIVGTVDKVAPLFISLGGAVKGVGLAAAGASAAMVAIAAVLALPGLDRLTESWRRFGEEVGGVSGYLDSLGKLIKLAILEPLADLLGLTERHGAELRDYGGFLKDVAGTMVSWGKTILAVTTPLGLFAKALDHAREEMKKLQDLVAPAETITRKLTESVQDHARAQAEQAMETMGVTRESIELKRAQQEQERQQRLLEAASDALAEKTKKVKEEYQKVTTSTREYSFEMKVLSQEYSDAIKSAAELEQKEIRLAIARKSATGSIIDMAEEAAKLNAQVNEAVAANSAWGKSGEEAVQEIVTAIPKIAPELEPAKREIRTFGEEVSTIITNTAQDIGKAMFDGDLSFGERMISMLKSIGAAAVSKFVEPFLNALTGPEGLITKGINILLDKLGILDGIFGGLGGGAAASGVGSAVGGVASGAGSAADGIGSAVTGAIAQGALGWVGAIGGVASAISGIIGNFQMARQENTLNAIEESTRYSKMYTGGSGGEKGHNILTHTGYIHEYMSYVVDDLRGSGDNIKTMLADIRGNTFWALKKMEGWDGWLEGAVRSMEWSLSELRVKDMAPTVNVYLDGSLIMQQVGQATALQGT